MTSYGPIVRDQVKSSIPQMRIYKKCYVQKPPYVDRLPYSYSKVEQVLIPNPWGFTPSSVPGVDPSLSFPSVYAKAYGKFIEDAKASVNLAVDLAERKQAIDMMASRVMQLYRFSRNIASFRFSAAARDLGLRVLGERKTRRVVYLTVATPNGDRICKFNYLSKKKRKVHNPSLDGEVKFKRTLKFFGDHFLEYHFGWEPLVKDIGDAVQLIHDTPFKGLTRSVEGRASEYYSKPSFTDPAKWSGVTVGYYPKVSYRILADVTISDPNILRLNQMGFVNPAVIAWELVPFSFVVDWFVNVGEVLSAFTDLAGLSLSNSTTSYRAIYEDTTYWTGGIPDYSFAPFATIAVYGRKAVYVRRSLGVSTPKLSLKPIKWPSPIRGATAVSLLTQFLRNH
ncbi:maturation protein [ssRNA phage Gephyllon.1_13]|uniref:Maturation protein n=2 Tax=Fiersviridae TaxID=2842319 RepID=A0A8S5L1S7_9VIRU|nr:maturation protein [ssRNA phage Gephyllon.1_13]QDH90225.1 MAG: hypothetical protein H1BulkLitter51109_000003 [Leviviridae sp.]DAD51396.1 TPA_asm: maturation protein [ssRNA phage Gephyllon.1_13]